MGRRISNLEKSIVGGAVDCAPYILQRTAQKAPLFLRLILTHIFWKALARQRGKVEVLMISTIREGLQGPFAKSNCKMWIRISLSKAGMNGRSFRAGWVEGKHHSS